MRTLFQVLLDYDLALLRAIAWHWEHTLQATRLREAAEELAAAVLDPLSAAHVWDELPEPARAALGALLAADGRMPAGLFFRRFGAIQPAGPGKLEREQLWRNPSSVAEELWYRGLIARAFDAAPAGPEEFVFIPRDLRGLLPAPEHAPPDPPGALAPAPTPFHAASAALVDDATTLLAYLHVGAVRAGTDAARVLPALAPFLRDTDAARFAFLWRVVQAAGLAVPREVAGEARPLLRPDPVDARRWLESERGPQLAALAEAWRADAEWRDLCAVPGLVCEDTGWREEPLLVRRAILGHLAAVPAETWWGLESFVQALKARDPDFARGEYESWYIRRRDAGTGPDAYLRGFATWEAVEGALLAYVVLGPLHWLGLADTSAAGAFRLNADGAAFTRTPLEAATRPALPPAAPGEPMRVRPDGTVEVLPGTRAYERFQLARVSAWLDAGEAYRYRLTPTGLARARAQGITVERLLDFLQRQTSGPLPVTVRQALTRWDVHGAEVTLDPAVVVRVATPGLLAELLQNTRTARHILEPLGPQAALVRRSEAGALAAAIRGLGYLVDEEKDENSDGNRT